ncbi:MAG: orange carotenoid protein N-terminal domain-containing protein [Prochloraceae cyanobacterium]|nr:orange carotenoid protein N-terminal domain-containing protein [Prochloraceae cyanobacterium]
MTYTTDSALKYFSNPELAEAVPATISLFQRLNVDDQLGLLWFAYTEIGRSITPAAPGAARLQFAQGLLEQIQAMSHEQQLEVMRDLAKKLDTPISRAYGVLTNNTKLAFWYKLAELMEQGKVVPVPASYKMSTEAVNLLARIQNLDFSQQITVLRKVAADMGRDPFAA